MGDSEAAFLFAVLCGMITAAFLVRKHGSRKGKYAENPSRYIAVSVVSAVLAVALLGGLSSFIAAAGATSSMNENASWNLKVMQAETLERYSAADEQVIAFIDTGISDDLAEHYGDRIIAEYNAIDGSSNVSDANGHGTAMVSAACNDGYKGVYGLAQGADLIIVKATDENGNTDNPTLLKGLQYVSQQKATVVNISLGGFKTDKKVADEIERLVDSGVSVVAASGDQGNKDILFPASVEGVISVAARQGDNSIWKDSNTSNELTCAFPGYEIAVLAPSESGELEKGEDTGTSVACAIASSYIAQYRAYTLAKNHDEIEAAVDSLGTLSDAGVNYLLPFERF